MLIVQMSI